MDFHVCKERRNSNPDSMMNCNNASGSGSPRSPGSRTPSASPEGSTGTLNLQICPTTGGIFQVDIASDQTVDSLRKQVSKKLGVPQDRISLLHRERLLKEGTLLDNQITDGSRITLLPNVESGLMSSPPDLSVMQALENLSEGQVNDFLTGKSPLTLAMRLGNHVMFLQLQLSTVSPSTKRPRPTTPPPQQQQQQQQRQQQQQPVTSSARGRQHRQPSPMSPVAAGMTSQPTKPVSGQSGEQAFRNQQLKLPTMLAPPSVMTPPPSPKSPSGCYSGSGAGGGGSSYSYPACPSSVTSFSSRQAAVDPANTPPPSPCYGQKDQPTIHVNDRAVTHGDNRCAATADGDCKTNGTAEGDHLRTCRQAAPPGSDFTPFLDNSTLSEAKRSLSMKLKEFSESPAPELTDSAPSGAVIESMQKLGRGVYSGTFSGTLNAALQDHEGRPKRSVSTIVHILNDLLGATPPRPGHFFRNRNAHRQNKESSQANDSSKIQQENQAIRGKVQQLQMLMEERKRRRQARRQHRAAPYPRPEQAARQPGAGGAACLPPDVAEQRPVEDTV